MTTEKDLNTLNLSPTNKDYYQVWSELIETAGKLSERWDPSSTNESDPGIVLLKVLTAIADKINYNIDKNILEAFMPTAAQAESMKRLCDMLGYHVGYYESATTDVTIRYVGNTYTLEDNPERLPDGTDDRGIGLVIPAFTVLHNEDKTIYYSTTQEARLTNEETFITVPCIEGQRILSETNTGNVVTLNNLDSNNRYYLPEIQIAENGIFVYGTAGGLRTTTWKKVNNLNIIPNDTKAYSFGFDSKENRPYLQFPNDIGLLIEDGLEVYYIRTSGAAGNISARTLTALEKPTDGAWKDYSDNEKFVVNNPDAALNGKNPENIEQAYNGFKKTIGTFDTLVTCRDYINKIYQLVDEQNNELVSNVIVSDIRDDINRAHVLCSFSDYGIIYVEKANAAKASTVINSTLDNQGIDHFDLVIYPFKAYRRLHDAQDFKNSFTYSDAQMPLISAQLADIKSIAHSYSTPVGKEITCIKNYLKLNARISTINKVNSAEESLILNNIKSITCDNRWAHIIEYHYVGFLTFGASHILFRDITEKEEYKWIKYPITQESKQCQAFYSIESEVDIFTDEKIIINLSEGILDITSAYLNLGYNESNTMNIAVCGKHYVGILSKLVNMGFVGENIILNIFADNDKTFNNKNNKPTTIEYFKKVLNKMKHLYGEVNIYYNTISKDIGVPRQEISLQKYRL